MGCCGDREKALAVTEEQKWDYITLSDFKSRSCLTPFSYAWLWVLVFVSVAVYAADAFTAVNLLAFNKWSLEKPVVSFDIIKWIFAVCIIVSYVFLAYRWIRAWRVLRSGSVTECYLEPLAVIFQSIRLTKEGQGWRRFLVFAELTRSRKGVDYIALFVYFQFKGALLIIVAQGPRMVINALTLWAVMQAELIPVGDHAAPKDVSNFAQFFNNIEVMIDKGNKRETVIYFTMLFSLVIWVIAALGLILSVILYVFFLWHYIPSSDGTLTRYCRRKIEARLERIVNKKVKKALEKEDQKRRKEERLALKRGDTDGPAARGPTLPKLGGFDDETSSVYSGTTLPPYSSNAPSRSNTTSTNSTTRAPAMKPSLPSLAELQIPNRSDTSLAYSTDAPLLSQPGAMGMSSPMPPLPTQARNGDYFGDEHSVYAHRGQQNRPFSPMSQGRASPRPFGGPPRIDTYQSNDRVAPPHVVSPLAGDATFSPYDNSGTSNGPSYELSPVEASPLNNASLHYHSRSNGSDDYRPPELPSVLRSGSPAQQQPMNNNYGPPHMPRSGTAPPSNSRPGLPAALHSAIQRREASQPLPNRGPGNAMQYQQRSVTAPIQQPGYGQGPYARSNTTTPGAGQYRRY